jgi:hypothetical protein
MFMGFPFLFGSVDFVQPAIEFLYVGFQFDRLPQVVAKL